MFLTGASATFMGWLLQWAIGLRAAVSIASERERATWDALLMSPLEPREIVRAKVFGSLYALRWMVAAMILAWTLALVVGAVSIHEYVVWIAGNTVAGALMAAIGVRCSLSLPTATKAMTWTIALWLTSLVGVACPCLRGYCTGFADCLRCVAVRGQLWLHRTEFDPVVYWHKLGHGLAAHERPGHPVDHVLDRARHRPAV